MLAYNAYAWLLRHAPLSLIGTYAYVNPIVAVALGAVFLAEPITPRTLVASAVIIAAVAMIVTARGRAQRGAEVDSPEEAIHPTAGAGDTSAGEAPAGDAPAGDAPAAKPVSLALDPRRGSSG